MRIGAIQKRTSALLNSICALKPEEKYSFDFKLEDRYKMIQQISSSLETKRALETEEIQNQTLVWIVEKPRGKKEDSHFD